MYKETLALILSVAAFGASATTLILCRYTHRSGIQHSTVPPRVANNSYNAQRHIKVGMKVKTCRDFETCLEAPQISGVVVKLIENDTVVVLEDGQVGDGVGKERV